MGELPLRPDTLVQKSESAGPPTTALPPPRAAAEKAADFSRVPTMPVGSVQGLASALRGAWEGDGLGLGARQGTAGGEAAPR